MFYMLVNKRKKDFEILDITQFKLKGKTLFLLKTYEQSGKLFLQKKMITLCKMLLKC